MKSRIRSSNFFSSVALSRRAVAAGVPAFLLAAAVALGVSAVPARAANVTVYDRGNLVASGDSLDAVKSSIANDSTIVLSGGTTASGSLLQVPVSSLPLSFALTIKSAVTGSPKTCVNTADAYLFSDDRSGQEFSLKVRDVVFSGGAGIIRSKWGVTVDAADSTFSGNHAASSGGVIYSNGNVEFAHILSSQLENPRGSVTFTGNTAGGTPNDVYAGGNVVINDNRSPYSFDGGIVTRGCFDVSGYSDVTFKGGAVNAITNEMTISRHSSATFANDGEGASNTFKGGLLLLEGSTIKIGTSAAEGEASGTVKFAGNGTLDLTDGTLVFEAGAKLALSPVDSTVTMKVKNWTDDETNALTLGAGTKLELTSDASATTIRSALTLAGDIVAGTLDDEGNFVGETFVVVRAIADGAGTISAKNITLNGLYGANENAAATTALTATGTLTLAGTTNTDGTVMAGTTLAVSGDATLSGIVVSGATTVTGVLTLEANGNLGALNVAATGALRLGEGVSADASSATVSGELALGEGSALNVTGTNAVAVKSLTMNGGWLQARGDVTVASAIADGAGSVLGKNVTLNGVSVAAGKTLSAVAYDTLTLAGETTGLLVSADERLVVTGTATLSDVYVGDYGARTAGTTEISGTLTLVASDAADAEHVIGATTLKSGGTLNVNTDATADVAFAADATGATASVSGATLRGNVTLSGATNVLTLTNANVTGTLSATGGLLHLFETNTAGAVAISDGATVVMEEDATLSARTISVLSGASLTADFSKISVEETLSVNADATATLTIDAENAVVDKLKADGAVTLSGGNAFSLGNLRGAGTVEKTGAGALTLGASADFTGTLKISAGAATLSEGATFGGSLGFFSENETLTAHDGATIAGTLTLGSGTTLELGGRDAKATVSVGALAAGGSSALPFSVRAQSASVGAVTIVHDVYSANEYDVLRVGSGADLSFATALLRAGSGLNVSALADAPDGVTLTLVEGDVARGYGALQLADELVLANFALSPDGTTASVGLGANALAAGVFPLETTAYQRSVARAATRAGTASGYGAALNALTNPHDTLAALDALGAGHAASMMPAQIDGAWNRLRSVMNAAGTGARLGSETELAAWAQYAGSWTDVDSLRERASWTRRMHGAHAGVERAFASGWTAGAALGFEDSEQKTGGAKIEDDALSASFYARRTQGAFTQTAALSFARHDYETRRTVAFPGYAARTRGDTLGFTAALSYEASYAFAVADWAKLSPVASLSAAWNTIEGWTESGADASLRCGDQDALTWLAGVGGRADFEFANPFADAAKARAGAYALFTAEFGERSCGVDAEFADTGAGFTARYDDPSRYALQLGLTASLPLSGNTSLFGGVSTELREDETNLNANVGVRFAW